MRQSFRTNQSSGPGAGKKVVNVVLLNKEELEIYVEPKGKVQDVFNQVCEYLSLRENEYFGLAQLIDGEFHFLDPECKLTKYTPKCWKSGNGCDSSGKPAFTLYFKVQFYVDHELLLRERICRHHYYLQLRENFNHYCQLCTEERCFLLASYALQADLGNFLGRKHSGQYFDPRAYFPAWVLDKRGLEYIVEHMPSIHRDLRGMTKSEAQLHFVKESSVSPAAHNLHFYRLKKRKNEDPGSIWLGICAKGIEIYEEDEKGLKSMLTSFQWPNIGKLYFEKKKFEIRAVGVPDQRKFTYYTGSDERSKYLLQLCRSTHMFQMAIQPKLAEIQHLEAEDKRRSYRESYIYSDTSDLAWEQEQASISSNMSLQNITTLPKKGDPRISVISNTSSNTTSGIVSDKMHISFDDSEVEDREGENAPDSSKRDSYMKSHSSIDSLACSSSIASKESGRRLRLIQLMSGDSGRGYSVPVSPEHGAPAPLVSQAGQPNRTGAATSNCGVHPSSIAEVPVVTSQQVPISSHPGGSGSSATTSISTRTPTPTVANASVQGNTAVDVHRESPPPLPPPPSSSALLQSAKRDQSGQVSGRWEGEQGNSRAGVGKGILQTETLPSSQGGASSRNSSGRSQKSVTFASAPVLEQRTVTTLTASSPSSHGYDGQEHLYENLPCHEADKTQIVQHVDPGQLNYHQVQGQQNHQGNQFYVNGIGQGHLMGQGHQMGQVQGHPAGQVQGHPVGQVQGHPGMTSDAIQKAQYYYATHPANMEMSKYYMPVDYGHMNNNLPSYSEVMEQKTVTVSPDTQYTLSANPALSVKPVSIASGVAHSRPVVTKHYATVPGNNNIKQFATGPEEAPHQGRVPRQYATVPAGPVGGVTATYASNTATDHNAAASPHGISKQYATVPGEPMGHSYNVMGSGNGNTMGAANAGPATGAYSGNLLPRGPLGAALGSHRMVTATATQSNGPYAGMPQSHVGEQQLSSHQGPTGMLNNLAPGGVTQQKLPTVSKPKTQQQAVQQPGRQQQSPSDRLPQGNRQQMMSGNGQQQQQQQQHLTSLQQQKKQQQQHLAPVQQHQQLSAVNRAKQATASEKKLGIPEIVQEDDDTAEGEEGAQHPDIDQIREQIDHMSLPLLKALCNDKSLVPNSRSGNCSCHGSCSDILNPSAHQHYHGPDPKRLSASYAINSEPQFLAPSPARPISWHSETFDLDKQLQAFRKMQECGMHGQCFQIKCADYKLLTEPSSAVMTSYSTPRQDTPVRGTQPQQQIFPMKLSSGGLNSSSSEQLAHTSAYGLA